MTWQPAITFSIGFSIDDIKASKSGMVKCVVKLTPECGIESNSTIFNRPDALRAAFRSVSVEYGQKYCPDAKFLVTKDFDALDDRKKQKWSSNEGVKVSYSHKVMNEGVSTNTVITRYFKNFPKKAYVLSESYFDLGRDTSKLSNSMFAKKLKTRSQVFEYVKSNLDAKIFNLTESQTYKVSSFTGYRPSLMTPLYENVYVVKFNDDDTVSTMRYLGKFKIQ
jgi:hypothetical protein